MKTFLKVAITLGVLAVAIGLGLLVWRDYLLYPWTRDGQTNAYVVGIAARVSGPMVKVTVIDNQWVDRGDLLFEIDPTDYAQTLASAEASLVRAKVKAENLSREVERRRQLVADKLISLEEFQTIETQYAEAMADIAVDEANLELARLDLSYTKVYATVDGYVTNLQVAEGTYVTKGQPLVALIDYDSFWVYGYFKETDLRNIEPGDRAKIHFMGHPFEPLEAKVESIGWGIADINGSAAPNLLPRVEPTVDWVRLAQRFPVRLKLVEPPPKNTLRIGRTASVMIYPDQSSSPSAQDSRASGDSSSSSQGAESASYPKTLIDGRGDTTIIPTAPKRIVSLAPSATEIMLAMGQDERLVAVTDFCAVPEELDSLPRLSVFPSPPFEAVVSLQPDLVLLADITNENDVRRLRRLGIPSVVLNSAGYDGVMADITLVGNALEAPEAASKLNEKLTGARKAVRNDLKAKSQWKAPRVVLFTNEDGTYAAGADTFGDGLITEAGGLNIAAEVGPDWPQLNPEFLVNRDPEVILISLPEGHGGPVEADLLALYRADPVWSQLSAVQSGRVYAIDSNLFNVPGPRIADALKQVAQAIQDN